MNAYFSAFCYGVRRPWTSKSVLLLIVGFYTIIIFVMTSLWHAAVTAKGGDIAGYSLHELTWYIIFTEAVVFGIELRRIEDIGNEIVMHQFETERMLPKSVVGIRIAKVFGESISRFGAVLAVGALIGFVKVGRPESFAVIVLALFSSAFALAINTMFIHLFAASAFWLGRLRSSWLVYQKLVFLPGGMMLPLDFYPDWFQRVAFSLPFWTVAFAPGSMIANHGSYGILIAQAITLSITSMVCVAVYLRGHARLAIV